MDGFAYYLHSGNQEFKATIEAFTYPEEFLECEGVLAAPNGLFVTNQSKRSFGLSYRTLVGDPVDGTDLGYKLHLIYNALASPADVSRNTLSDRVEPIAFSWEVTTKAPRFVGYKPTSYFVVDSRRTPTELMTRIEEILYGTEVAEPRLPSVEELIFMFQEYESESFDAGTLTEQYFAIIDAGDISEAYETTIDGGVP